MKSVQGLKGKIRRLEVATGANKPPRIPVEDCLHVIQGHTDQEIAEKQETIRKQTAKKYGPRALKQLGFLVIRLGEYEADKTP